MSGDDTKKTIDDVAKKAKQGVKKAARVSQARKRKKSSGRRSAWYTKVPDSVLADVVNMHYRGKTLYELYTYLVGRGFALWKSQSAAEMAISRYLKKVASGDMPGRVAMSVVTTSEPEVVHKAVQEVKKSLDELEVIRGMVERLLLIIQEFDGYEIVIEEDGKTRKLPKLAKIFGDEQFKHYVAAVELVRKLVKDHAELRVDLGLESDKQADAADSLANAVEAVRSLAGGSKLEEVIRDPEKRVRIVDAVRKVNRVATLMHGALSAKK